MNNMKKLLLLYILIPMGTLAQTIVNTQDGQVKGYEKDTIRIFKGIPFAAPPVGEFRWKEPQPVEPWQGVKECLEFAASPIQNTPEPFLCWTEEFIAKPEPISEDCLYLNVWTPAKKKDEKLPVMAWIYGGGLSSGSANCDIYDGEEMAKQGIIFVSLNYRVGVLGFMAHPELSKESGHNASGNYGFMDQLQGLRWVKENIASFGGDPSNVTIAGQSAGSFSVNAQIASPLAQGYFHKAIAQSGGLLSGRLLQELPDAEKQGVKLMQLAASQDLKALRQLPANKLQELSNMPEVGRFGVVTDGYFLPKDINAYFKNGKHNQVPVLTGWVSGDGGFLTPQDITVESFQKMTQERFNGRYEIFRSLFPTKSDEEAQKAQEKLTLLGFAGVPAYKLAQYNSQKTWLYEFQHVPTDKPGFPNYGAFHTSEVPFALHTLNQWNRDWKPEERTLENQMSAYWVNFAKTGNPNGEGLPQWNAFQAIEGELLLLDTSDIRMQKKYTEEFKFLSQ
ncbi:carboxylesterase/lipase family protein [Maribacter sp. CXY002]|uniref:carboxylesterase/lipase family protein n=1 Tax=Maribacter luteocoastalis TaxID=3407671 RepID=UPI003B684921